MDTMTAGTSQLAVVVPVRQIDNPACGLLAGWATQAPTAKVITVGRVEAVPPTLPGNLTVIDSNADLYGAMNAGLAAAQSRFVLFMGIDDRLLTTNVERVVAALSGVPASTPLVVLPFRIGGRQRTLKPVEGRLMAFHHQGVLFNRESLLRHGGYSSEYRMHSDLDAMFKLQKEAAACLVPVPLVEFRLGGISTSGRNAGQSFREITAIYKAHRVNRFEMIYAVSMTYLLLHRLRYLLRQALGP